jgi:hypothetical protein
MVGFDYVIGHSTPNGAFNVSRKRLRHTTLLATMDSSEQPSERRQRTDTTDPVVPIRSEPWFSDGTIVLQVSAMQFRVYRGTLSANSPVQGGCGALQDYQELE